MLVKEDQRRPVQSDALEELRDFVRRETLRLEADFSDNFLEHKTRIGVIVHEGNDGTMTGRVWILGHIAELTA